MKHHIRLLTKKQIVIPALISVVLLAVGFFYSHRVTAQNFNAQERLVTIYDGANTQTVITTAGTVQDVLQRTDTQVAADDSIDPAPQTQLDTNDYTVTIHRARPVTVVDGTTRQVVMSPYESPQKIAQSVGIVTYPEDKLDLKQVNDFTQEQAGLELDITRATPINLILYGQSLTVRTQAKTVGDLFAERNIKLGPNDGASLPANTPITADMSLRIWRNGVQTINQNEPVDFPIQQIQDNTQFVGYHEVRTPGVAGQKTVTYQIDMRDGIEVSRTQIQSVVTQQPQPQVEVVGTKVKQADPASNEILGHQMMLSAGFGEDQWSCLDNLWTHESHWNQYAANASGAYGIPQALPGSKMGDGWHDDPSVQINWGLGYIKGRYSTPCGAWGTWQSKGWY